VSKTSSVFFAGAVVVAALGVRHEVVRERAPVDDPDHLIRRGVDDVLLGTRVVALQDADGDAVVGVEPVHLLGRKGSSEHGDSQEHQRETIQPLAAHRDLPPFESDT
jgi:hypothetical protein